MTRPKHPPRRLGFAADEHRIDGDVQDFARWVFLAQIAADAPAVLGSLADLADDELLSAWAQCWNLDVPWMLDRARTTRQMWRQFPSTARRAWNDCERPAALVRDDEPPAARPLKDPDHFAWLVRFQLLGEGWHAIARAVQREPRAVQMACQSLAKFIGLPLRRPRRGRPASTGQVSDSV